MLMSLSRNYWSLDLLADGCLCYLSQLCYSPYIYLITITASYKQTSFHHHLNTQYSTVLGTGDVPSCCTEWLSRHQCPKVVIQLRSLKVDRRWSENVSRFRDYSSAITELYFEMNARLENTNWKRPKKMHHK